MSGKDSLIELQARLNEAKSKNLVNKDIDRLQRRINKLKLQAEIDPKSLSELGRQLETVTSQKLTLSEVAVDARQVRKLGEEIGNTIRQTISEAAGAAGMDLSEYADRIGQLAGETGLQGSQLGDSVKTMITRTTNAAELLGIDESVLAEAEEALRSVGIEVRKTNGEFQDFYITMGELAKRWDKLSDMEKSSLASALAGTQQINVIQTLISGWSDYESVVGQTNQSAGDSLKNQQSHAQSLSDILGELSDVWGTINDDEINDNEIDASALKGLVDAGTAVSSLTEKMGLLKTAAGLALTGFFNKGRSKERFCPARV